MGTEKGHVDVRQGYDQWSEVYDHDLNPLVLLEEPLVRSWVPRPRGLSVADVGCGTGRHSLWLADAGARVDAFDTSVGMMAKAKEKLKAHGVRFHEHTLPAPLPARAESFDLVLLALVADHIADLPGTFTQLHRVMKPGAELIFTVLHPAMNLKGVTARFTNPASGTEVRVAAFEHTYADYVMGVLRAGLKIEEIVEQTADEALVARTPRAQKYLGWPMLLAMRLSR